MDAVGEMETGEGLRWGGPQRPFVVEWPNLTPLGRDSTIGSLGPSFVMGAD